MSFLADFAAHAPFLLTVTPLFGAVLAWIQARRGVASARQTAITNAALTLGVACLMAWNFSPDMPPRGQPPTQMGTNLPWGVGSDMAGAIRVHFAVGVDGVSLGPLCLVALIGWVVIVTADRCSTHWSGMSYAGFLLGQALAMAVFAAQDFVLFLLACELWTWWTFFVIGRHGGTERRTAAQRWLISASQAHAVWGLAGIGLAVCYAWIHAEARGQAAGISFRYGEMVWSLARWVAGNETALEVWTSFQPRILPLWLVGLWLRWPLFPFHGWRHGALAEARAPVAAFCGALAILQAGYVLFRFVTPLFPPAGGMWAQVLSGYAGWGVFYFGVLANSAGDWRKLGSCLSLGMLQAALICGISGSPDIALTGWHMLHCAALTVAAVWLLIGWREQDDSASGMIQSFRPSHRSPRWLAGMAVGCGLFAAVPCLAVLAGHVPLNLLELVRHGLPSLTLLSGGLLASWAVLRTLLTVGLGEPSETAAAAPRDLCGRELWIGALLVAALWLGMFPQIWRPHLLPTWQRLHDPFADVEQATSHRSIPPAPEPVRISTHKPVIVSQAAAAPSFPWFSAPAFWAICGAALLLMPSGWLTPRWEAAIAVVGLIGGLLAEAIGGDAPAGDPGWAVALRWSLGMIGLVQLTATHRDYQPSSSGATLLRLSAIGGASLANQLALIGLAWELAEIARWLSCSGAAQNIQRAPREHLRHLLSSVCFWLGVAGCVGLAKTANLVELAARLAQLTPRDGEGQVSGLAPSWGLAGAVLILSAVGIRAGWLPWSFGRREFGQARDCTRLLTDDWLNQLLGLTLLLQFVPACSEGYGQPVAIMLAIAAAGTALWSGLSLVGELKAVPVLRGITAWQGAGLLLLVAALAAQTRAPGAEVGGLIRPEALLLFAGEWMLATSIAVCGMAAIISRISEPEFGDLFLEQHRGLLAKRTLEAVLLIGLLSALLGRWLWAGAWPLWCSLVGLVMTPQRLADNPPQTQPVLLAAVVVVLLSGLFPLSRAAHWVRHIAFDPPVALPEGRQRPGDLVLALIAAVLSLAAGIVPGLFARML